MQGRALSAQYCCAEAGRGLHQSKPPSCLSGAGALFCLPGARIARKVSAVAEMLRQPQPLRLIGRPDIGAIEDIGPRQHRLIDQPPDNLPVPPHFFETEDVIVIGLDEASA